MGGRFWRRAARSPQNEVRGRGLCPDQGRGRAAHALLRELSQFFIRTADVTGTVSLPEGTEMVMPGDNATLHIELIAPVALTEGLRFALREGGKTVGAGVVSKITG